MAIDASWGRLHFPAGLYATIRYLAAVAFLAASAREASAGTITTSSIDLNFTIAEQSLFSGAVAVFEDSDSSLGSPSDFVATINWGDGTPIVPGTIFVSSGAFTVVGSHTYTDEGTFNVTVVITEAAGAGAATVIYTATVTEADVLSGTPLSFSAPSGVSFTATVANFTDTFTAAVPSDFTATINWGDATTSAGTVTGSGALFQVSGTHTYAAAGTYSVMVTLSDDAPGTATATVTSTAHIAAGLAVTVNSFSVGEGTPFNGTVATFSDANTEKTSADCSATIDWGDGSTSPGTITGGLGSFAVTGAHTYVDEGTFTLTVTVNDGTTTASGTGTATVTEADVLTGTPMTFNPVTTVPFTGPVATFADPNTANVPSDFIATINWGDGSSTAGVVVSLSPGSFQVRGTHTYVAPGTFSVTVTLSDDAPGTATATVTSTALVASHSVTVTVPGVSVPEATPFIGTVATFTDTDTTKTPASFTSIINWGDGTPTSVGTVTGASGSFTLTGQHTYADEGSFPLTVVVTENPAGTTGTGTGTATATEADVLTGTPITFTPVATIPFTGNVATFSDTNTSNVAGDFTATINWGDGNTTAGTVTGGGASYTVSGTHTYAAKGTFSVGVTLVEDSPGTATATVSSTANASAAPEASASAVPALDFYGLLALGFALGIISVLRLRGPA